MLVAKMNVNGMSCDHCVKTITKAVSDLVGIGDVSVDLTGKTVTFEYDPDKILPSNIKNVIEDQGYDVIE